MLKQNQPPSSRRQPATPEAGGFVSEPGTLIVEDFSLKHGFVQIPRIVLYARNLSRHAKMLYAVLLGYAWQEQRCFPGYARLCEDLQASENSVRTYMRELEAANLLRQHRRGLGRTNLYLLPDLRTSKIEVQEPQLARTSKSEVLEPQDSQAQEPQDSQDIIETVEEDSEEKETDISNIRKAHPKKSKERGRAQPLEDAQPSSSASTRGVEAVGDVLARRAGGRARSRPRPEAESEEYQRIQAWIADRAREFYDTAPLKSSTTRAWNLFQRSGLPIDVFESKIFQARALTQEATARITKTAVDPHVGARRKSKMAYFFAALEDQAGLRDEEKVEPAAEGSASPIGPAAGSKQGAGKATQPPKTPPRGKSEGRSKRTPDSTGPYSAFVKS